MNWNEFNKISSEEWKAKAEADLKNKNSTGDYYYNVEGDYSVDSFITNTIDENNIRFNHIPSSCVRIRDFDSKIANALALKYLSYGSSAIMFSVDSLTDFDILLDGIHLDMIELVLEIYGDVDQTKSRWQAYLTQCKCPNAFALFTNPNEIIRCKDNFKSRIGSFRNVVNNIDNSKKLIVTIELKKDFLAQIAELRAFRIIWANHGNAEENLIIIGIVNGDTLISEEVHPLIVANYQMLSAYLGMSNFICGYDTTQTEELVRLSLNIQHIFSEESRLTSVADPVAGSYIVEALTAQMVNNA